MCACICTFQFACVHKRMCITYLYTYMLHVHRYRICQYSYSIWHIGIHMHIAPHHTTVLQRHTYDNLCTHANTYSHAHLRTHELVHTQQTHRCMRTQKTGKSKVHPSIHPSIRCQTSSSGTAVAFPKRQFYVAWMCVALSGLERSTLGAHSPRPEMLP